MLWEKCIRKDLYKYVCLRYNFIILNQLDITYHKANRIVKHFVKTKSSGLRLLQIYLKDNWLTFRYVYANLFPKYYSLNKKFCRS